MNDRETRNAWLLVAAAVLRGEYRKADESTKESIEIGLRGFSDETCRAAIKRLKLKAKKTHEIHILTDEPGGQPPVAGDSAADALYL